MSDNSKKENQVLNDLTASFHKIKVAEASVKQSHQNYTDISKTKIKSSEKTPAKKAIYEPFPKDWRDSSKFSKALELPGLPFIIIPIKAPLDDKGDKSLPEDEQWTWNHVKSQISKYVNKTYNKRCTIFAVIDLTAAPTDSPKYYKGSELFKTHKIFYHKVRAQTKLNGKSFVPKTKKYFKQFSRIIDHSIERVNKWSGLERQQPVLLVHDTKKIDPVFSFAGTLLKTMVSTEKKLLNFLKNVEVKKWTRKFLKTTFLVSIQISSNDYEE